MDSEKANLDNIIPIWQPIGKSTHIIAKQVSQKYNVMSSHTGTLDPMAEGVIIVLLGDDRNKKYEYAKFLKTYEFDIALGIKTDTYDGLGLVNAVDLPCPEFDLTHVRKTLSSLVGSYSQQVPNYSAIKVKGKPMHWWARESRLSEVVVPTRSGEIVSLEVTDLKEVKLSTLIDKVLSKVKLVEGNFRQDLVTECWNDFMETYDGINVKVLKVRVQMTKGLYVRTLSQDISSMLNTIGFVSNLVRTKNGIYDFDNSGQLETIIG